MTKQQQIEDLEDRLQKAQAQINEYAAKKREAIERAVEAEKRVADLKRICNAFYGELSQIKGYLNRIRDEERTDRQPDQEACIHHDARLRERTAISAALDHEAFIQNYCEEPSKKWFEI